MSIEAAAALSGAAEKTAGASGAAGKAGGFSKSMEKKAETAAGSLEAAFLEASRTYGVPVGLIRSVAKAESNFNPRAVSRAGAIGVMQLMPGTARSLGVSDPFDARQNIMGGTKYLKQNLERFGGDVSLALAAYNAGPGSVEKYGGIPPYSETVDYVRKVTGYMGEEGGFPAAGRLLSGASGTGREEELPFQPNSGDLYVKARMALSPYGDGFEGTAKEWEALAQWMRIRMMMDAGEDAEADWALV